MAVNNEVNNAASGKPPQALYRTRKAPRKCICAQVLLPIGLAISMYALL